MISTKKVKRVFIIHGWDGDIKKNWFPWLKRELTDKGFKVLMPQMPNPSQPKISVWVSILKSLVKDIDEDTYFIGHSIGCQAILRFLQSLKTKKKIGGAIFISGWFELKEFAYTESPALEMLVRRLAKPWIEKKLDFSRIKKMILPGKSIYLISDDDYYVDMKNSFVFQKLLGVKIIVEHHKGHYAESDGIRKMPIVVKELLRISH